MRILSKRVLAVGTAVVVALVAAPGAAWLSLSYQPGFYRANVGLSREKLQAKAKRFVSQSLQLRNDIANEPTWEAVFSDDEVNAWLAEDLVTHFADQLPPEVHQPRVMFEIDRVTLAFELDQGPFRSVIWVVATPRVPEDNVLELTFEKIRAGVVPVPADQIIARIVATAQRHGIDVTLKKEGGFSVATFRYTPDSGRDDVMLETVQIAKGEIRLAGRSDREKGRVSSPTLPTRQVLQSKFPRRTSQARPSARPVSGDAPLSSSRPTS